MTRFHSSHSDFNRCLGKFEMLFTAYDNRFIVLANLSIFVLIFLESDGNITSTDTNNDPLELHTGKKIDFHCGSLHIQKFPLQYIYSNRIMYLSIMDFL